MKLLLSVHPDAIEHVPKDAVTTFCLTAIVKTPESLCVTLLDEEQLDTTFDSVSQVRVNSPFCES